jgi:hypothetical protein
MSNQGSPKALLKLQMAPQAYTLNILRLQEKGAQMCMSEWGQGLTFTKNRGPRFPPSPHISYAMDCPAILWHLMEWVVISTVHLHPPFKRQSWYPLYWLLGVPEYSREKNLLLHQDHLFCILPFYEFAITAYELNIVIIFIIIHRQSSCLHMCLHLFVLLPLIACLWRWRHYNSWKYQ